MNARDRMIERIARSIAFYRATHDQQIWYRSEARAIVDDLLDASAEGKAVERALKVVKERIA